MIKILRGLEKAQDLVQQLVIHPDIIFTARRGLWGWRGSMILDHERAVPIATTKKWYEGKEQAVAALITGVKEYLHG